MTRTLGGWVPLSLPGKGGGKGGGNGGGMGGGPGLLVFDSPGLLPPGRLTVRANLPGRHRQELSSAKYSWRG